jgi:hypothetical protein
MKVEKLIESQVRHLNKLKKRLNKLRDLMRANSKDETWILHEFTVLLQKYNANPVILKLLADFLQMVDDKNILKTYHLEHILLLHNELTRFNPLDLESQLETYYFLYNIMDDEPKADIQLAQTKKLIESEFLTVAKYRSEQPSPIVTNVFPSPDAES